MHIPFSVLWYHITVQSFLFILCAKGMQDHTPILAVNTLLSYSSRLQIGPLHSETCGPFASDRLLGARVFFPSCYVQLRRKVILPACYWFHSLSTLPGPASTSTLLRCLFNGFQSLSSLQLLRSAS